MTSGEWMGLVLGLFLFAWGLVDFMLWANGEQTFSQWVIKEAKKRLSFTVITLLLISVFAAWLIFHFELPAILMEHLTQ